jgi:hypothetical protein
VKPMRLADERGQLLIVTALGMVMLLGIAALSIDASFMYDQRNKLYAAADAAAKSGAIEVFRDNGLSPAALTAFGEQQVHAHGFDPLDPTISFVIHRCTDAGATCLPAFNDNRYVEAIVGQTTATFFGNVLGWVSATPGARAVAGFSSGPNCVVVFDHITMKISGISSIAMPNCSMVIGGPTSPTLPATHDMDNQAAITARNIGVVHTGALGCTGNCTNVTYGVTPPGDPLAYLVPPMPPAGHTCTTPFDITAATTMDASSTLPAEIDKYYCGFNFHGGTLALNPGTYYVNGPITAQNPGTDTLVTELGGGGVTIFLSAVANINLVSNFVELDITAPTTGPYIGILFYQDRGTPIGTPAVFGFNITKLAVRGAFYFPTANIQMKNENTVPTTNPCTLIVAWAIEVDVAQFTLDNVCSIFGGSPLLTVSLAE